MKKIFVLVILLIANINLSATMWRFYLGRIAVAEITTASVKIINLDPHAFPAKYSKTAYAVIVCKLDPKRSISIYDFSLRDDKFNRYPCIALRTGSEPFDGENWKIDKCDPDSWYSILFKIEDTGNYSGATVEMTLEYTLNSHNYANLKIPFKFSRSLSNPAQIPADGEMPTRP
ncbi:MAG: hypothetical protein PHS31_07285 [Victivallaceae bacterium]|nr:hypothetical protein [Victivallaceae bacterium]